MTANPTPAPTPRNGIPDAEYWKLRYEEVSAQRAESERQFQVKVQEVLDQMIRAEKAEAALADARKQANDEFDAIITRNMELEKQLAELERQLRDAKKALTDLLTEYEKVLDDEYSSSATHLTAKIHARFPDIVTPPRKP